MPAGIITYPASQLVGVAGRVFGVGQSPLEHALEGDAPASHTRHALPQSEEGQLRTAVFHGREIGVQLAHMADAHQDGAVNLPARRLILHRQQRLTGLPAALCPTRHEQ